MANFICPLRNARLTSKFGWRNIGYGNEWHQGVDLASTGKAPIYASAAGVISRAQVLSSYGKVVMIKHTINGKTYETNYAHLDSYCVQVGQRVVQGQQIGIMGNTGRAFGIHLHFEIHNGLWDKGQPNAIDPMNFISLTNETNTALTKEGELTMSQYTELLNKIKELEEALKTKQAITPPIKASKTHIAAWEWLKCQGITDGSNPQNFLTREQFASMLKRYNDSINKK
ncbi:UNVERIFIED_CONTAM: peptidase M23-like protein [Lysinibacillus xylanilyticus]|uniref:M23 family metallopeptidase n=1 Tax=Lysinibacillus xylanilyticus TaxID=582475 RepID=UPI000671378A|nr:M23 family metallopeptidase [Lysinibacillus xylanilyticus]